MFRRIVALFAFASGLASPLVARADCAAPRAYDTQTSGPAVTICATNPDSDGTCPRPGGMLRVDTATGNTVRIADDCDDAGCYVDPCVPPSSYLYGYATPLACCEACCGTAYFVAVTVGAVAGEACASDAGTTDAGPSPWDASNPTICEYASSGDDDSGGPVTFPVDAGTPSTPASSSGGSGGGGCAVAAPLGAEHAVIAIDGLALAVGLAFFARGRRRSR